MLIVTVAIIGIFVIAGLFSSWRRNAGRPAHQPKELSLNDPNQETLDAWQEAGKRLETDPLTDED